MNAYKRKTEAELQFAAFVSSTRKAIRHKYSLLAEAELNDALPRITAEFVNQVNQGKLPQIAIGELAAAFGLDG